MEARFPSIVELTDPAYDRYIYIGSCCTVEFLDGGGRDIHHIRARPQTQDQSMGSYD